MTPGSRARYLRVVGDARSSVDVLCEDLDDSLLDLMTESGEIPKANRDEYIRLRTLSYTLKDAREALDRAIGAIPE